MKKLNPKKPPPIGTKLIFGTYWKGKEIKCELIGIRNGIFCTFRFSDGYEQEHSWWYAVKAFEIRLSEGSD